MIKVVGRKLEIPADELTLGCVGENKVEIRQFEITDTTLFDFDFKIEVKSKVAGIVEPVKTFVGGSAILEWVVEESHIPNSGFLGVQLRAFDAEGLKWKSYTGKMFVSESLNAIDSMPAILPSEFEQMEARITAIKNEVVENAEQVADDKATVSADKALVIADTNAVSVDKDTVISAKQATELLKADVVTLKDNTEDIYSDCVGILNQQTSLLATTPTWYVKDTINVMNAITTMKDSDFCILISAELESQSLYRYFTKDIAGTPLVTPAWVWISDLSLLQLTQSYLLSILQLPLSATSGSYPDLTNKPNRYESFITVTTGIWDYALSDKIILTTTNLISITNITNGAIGQIVTDYDLTLPVGSKKAVDYDYIIATAGQSYHYTFVWTGTYYYFTRTVIA